MKQKIFTMIGALSVLSSYAIAKPWTNVQPAYNTSTSLPTVRVETGGNIGDKTGYYSFCDFDAKANHPFNLCKNYWQTDVSYNVGRNNAIELEGILSNYCNSLGAMGASVTGKLGSISGKLTYFAISNQPSVKLFTASPLTKRASASLLARYKTDSKTWYIEPELDYKVAKDTQLFVQGRDLEKNRLKGCRLLSE